MKKISFLFLIIILISINTKASAYIGPGWALGGAVLIIAIIAVLLLAIVAILYYPIKKLIRNIKNKKIEKNK